MKFLPESVAFLLFALAGFSQSALAQDDRLDFARNTIYAEGATRSSPYTLNFDHVFHLGDQLAYSYRAGFSVVGSDITIPVGVSVITGTGDHHFEASATVIPYLKLKDNKSDPSNLFLYFIPAVGYRFQKQHGGLFVRTSVGPAFHGNPRDGDFWNMHIKTYGYGSLGIGFTF